MQCGIFLFRSVPLNMVISVDNYTLRTGTEQNLEMAEIVRTLKLKKGLFFEFNAPTIRKDEFSIL